ncbi:hypothetical protein BGX28_007265 [Mortierella sp. GBA30]|nr:hypothetical protein BGX28_007265 [Mortierella sp. GBA30]
MTTFHPEPTTVNLTESVIAQDADADEVIDQRVFQQLLDLDEDSAFLRTVITEYFEQAERTIADMQEALSKHDFATLSSLGHFLKGSSAAVGVIKIKASCAKLQNFGERKDAQGTRTITDDEAQEMIEVLLLQMQLENEEAKSYLEALHDEYPQEESKTLDEDGE